MIQSHVVFVKMRSSQSWFPEIKKERGGKKTTHKHIELKYDVIMNDICVINKHN